MISSAKIAKYLLVPLLGSKQHNGHDILEFVDVYKKQKINIDKNMEEYENILSPTYEEIVLDLENQIDNLDGGYEKLTTEMSTHVEERHKAIDMGIAEMKTNIIDIRVKHCEILKEHLNEIKQIQSLIRTDDHGVIKGY